MPEEQTVAGQKILDRKNRKVMAHVVWNSLFRVSHTPPRRAKLADPRQKANVLSSKQTARRIPRANEVLLRE